MSTLLLLVCGALFFIALGDFDDRWTGRSLRHNLAVVVRMIVFGYLSLVFAGRVGLL